MNSILNYPSGVVGTLLSTELNSLSSNTVATGILYNLGNNYLGAEVELAFQFTNTPSANTSCDIYFLRAIDGQHFEDGGIINGSSIIPNRFPNLVFPVGSSPDNLSHRTTMTTVLPPGPFITLLKNNGTGQSLASSNNTLRILPNTLVVV